MELATKILSILVVLILFIVLFEGLGFRISGVVSNSMNHRLHDREFFLEFWDSKGFQEDDVDGFPLSRGFQGGDLLVLLKTQDIETGDVGAYYTTCSDCEDDVSRTRRCRKCTTIVTHRVFATNKSHVSFIPDNHDFENTPPLDEILPRKLVMGKVLMSIPKVGLPTTMLHCGLRKVRGIECDLYACLTAGDCRY